ncbi:PREDICTED: uncharacterized protein LOC101306317 [Fragaria vesca subsp. vesca]
MKCTHCKSTSHMIETCFYLIGFPDWWDDHIANRKEAQAKGVREKANSFQPHGNKNPKSYQPKGKPQASLQITSPHSRSSTTIVEPSHGDHSGNSTFTFMTTSGY